MQFSFTELQLGLIDMYMQLEECLKKAKVAQKAWRKTSFDERRAVLGKFVSACRTTVEGLTVFCSKVISWSTFCTIRTKFVNFQFKIQEKPVSTQGLEIV